MKKLSCVFAFVIVACLTTISTKGYAQKTSAKDSVAYAVGVSLAQMAFEFDSTLNVEIINRAFSEFYNKNPKMSRDEAQACIENYMQVILPAINREKSKQILAQKVEEEGFTRTPSGLVYKIIENGAGRKIQLNDSLEIHFTMYDIYGKQLQSSYENGKPLSFAFADDVMVAGFTEGLLMLNEGAQAIFGIPSDLAYGEQGGPVKGGEALIFDVDILKVTQVANANSSKKRKK